MEHRAVGHRPPFGTYLAGLEAIEIAPHLPSGFMDAPGDRSFGGFEDHCGFLVAEALQSGEDDRRLKKRRELVEGFEQRPISIPKLNGTFRVAVRIDCDRGYEARIIERHRVPALVITFRVQSAVQCDPIDPSEELASPLELRKLVIGLQKCVLRDVIGIAGLAC